MTDRAYARISLDTAASGSIAKQRSRLARHAHGEPEWYVDESVSGSKVPFAERPAGKQLLADLERGDRVLVTKIDRAARNVRDLLGLVEEIEKAGASIVFVDQNIDTAGPMGRFLLTLLGAVAELEAAIIAERRRESLIAFREEGRHAVGRAPYGLQSVPNPDGRGLVLRPHPEESVVLREAVESILAGESQRKWARVVGMGEPAFSRLLRNDRLAGVVSSGPEGVRLDEDQAVFSLLEWERLQEHLDRPEKTWTRTGGYGPALACGVCGDRLYLNLAKTGHHTYRCRRVKHAPGSPSASVMRVNADRHIETEFLARFGALPVIDYIEVQTSRARSEAVARARLDLEAVRTAQDRAETDEEEEALHLAYLRAKKALRAAEALPEETVTEEVVTGETFRDVWERSDDDARTGLLLRFGRWVVSPGRLPIAEKVRLDAVEDYLEGQF
jgi:DNA invertase Pin-like site-specific DNA recombinase